MFKKRLEADLETIFQLGKVTFDRPSDSQEQEAVFIDVRSPRSRVTDGREIAEVRGTVHVFANADKMPYGYFAKQIARAPSKISSRFFFHEIEQSRGTFLNIVERTLSFVYFYDSQYDPDLGTIETLNLNFRETP